MNIKFDLFITEMTSTVILESDTRKRLN